MIKSYEEIWSDLQIKISKGEIEAPKDFFKMLAKAYASQFVREAAEQAKTKIDYVAGQNFIGVDKASILSLLKLIEND